MGIEASYRRLSPERFQRILDDPAEGNAFFGPDPDEDEEAFEEYLDALMIDPGYLRDTNRTWHTLHYLLTGSTDINGGAALPFGLVVLGGAKMPWHEAYEGMRFLTPQQVKECADALERMTEEDLRERFRPETFPADDVYPYGWQRNAESIEIVVKFFGELRAFYKEAARSGEVIFASLG